MQSISAIEFWRGKWLLLAIIEWFSAKTWRMTIIIFKWWWRKGSFPPTLALILHTRALKVESIDAESKERQKFCVKEERARKLCRGQIMVFLDSKQMSLDFFLQKLGNNWRIIGRKCDVGSYPVKISCV